ncbi:MAG: hypothetical protein AAF280_00380 [Pseudomonadota bacterium]
MINPTLPHRGSEHLSQRYKLVVYRAARRWFDLRIVLQPKNPMILHRFRADVLYSHLAGEGI